MSEKVIELCFRSIVSYLNGNYGKSEVYKSQAAALNRKLEIERSCRYSVRELISSDDRDKLYELIG